jgi:hypothetical protein
MTHFRNIQSVVASIAGAVRSGVRRSPPLLALALLVGAAIFLAPEAAAQTQSAAVAAAPAGRESDAAVISAGVAKTTGLAISPLLVLVALGWYDFLRVGGFDAAPGALPIHANPWILIPFTVILGCVIAKKFASPAVPLPIRKMLDAAEYVEAKFSALIAAGLLLPTIVGAMAAAAGGDAPANTQVASLVPDPVIYALILVAVVGIFVSVWITFHVIDALIVLSPFAIVDAALVALRGSVLAILGLGLLISPFLGLALAVPLIVASVFFAGWCIRLDLFALVTAGDILFRRAADPYRPARVFVAARGYGAPIRTMGHAVPSARGARFSYRPMFVFPRRTIDLPYSRPVLVRGAIWSTMRDDASGRALFACPPRFNRVAASFAAHFGAVERDGFLRRGWRELRTFFSAIFGRPAEPATS